jgi:hypothetical protein
MGWNGWREINVPAQSIQEDDELLFIWNREYRRCRATQGVDHNVGIANWATTQASNPDFEDLTNDGTRSFALFGNGLKKRTGK